MLVLVDTSIWVDLLGKARKFKLNEEQMLQIATTPPIIQEVLQGINAEEVRRQIQTIFLAFPLFANPVDLELYLEGANIYSTARRKGITIRSSVDCLIAAIAIRYNLTIWHNDRDFEAISKFTPLKTTTKKSPL